jgi:hypothetical protein
MRSSASPMVAIDVIEAHVARGSPRTAHDPTGFYVT